MKAVRLRVMETMPSLPHDTSMPTIGVASRKSLGDLGFYVGLRRLKGNSFRML